MRSLATLLALACVLSGCAVSPKTFYASPEKVKDTTLCRTYFEAVRDGNAQYAADIAAEAQHRGLTYDQCQKKVATEDGMLIATAVVATAVGVGIACKDGCGGGGYVPTPRLDYDCLGGPGDGPYYVQGPIAVGWNDEYDLDRDGDGIGCEIGDYGA
jgi:hypothetical protein